MGSLRRKQRLALFLELGVGMPLNAALAVGLYRLLPAASGTPELAERIAHALQWCTVPAMVTLLSLWAVALGRATSEAIDPLAGRESKTMRVHIRVLTSNLEQLVLFALASLAVSTLSGPIGLQLIAVSAVMLAVNRMVFWVGYLRDPMLRAVGVSGSIYPVSALMLYAAYGSVTALVAG